MAIGGVRRMKKSKQQSEVDNERHYVWQIVLLLDDLNSGDPTALDRLRKHVGWDKEFEPPSLGDLIAWDFEKYYAMEHGGWEPCGLALPGKRAGV
jgi:hypothetical protein